MCMLCFVSETKVIKTSVKNEPHLHAHLSTNPFNIHKKSHLHEILKLLSDLSPVVTKHERSHVCIYIYLLDVFEAEK